MAELFSEEIKMGTAGYQKYRAHLIVTVENISNTQSRVDYTAYAEGFGFYGYGMRIAVLGGNSAEGQHPSSGHDHEHLDKWASDVMTTGSFVVNRNVNDYDYEVTATVGPGAAAESKYGAVTGGEASVTVSITVPAYPGDCYVRVDGTYQIAEVKNMFGGAYEHAEVFVKTNGEYQVAVP